MSSCSGGCVNGLCACSTVVNKPLLTLDDKCFIISECDKITGQLCLDDFAFPADGKQCIGLEIPKSIEGAEWKSLTLFDNNITVASPSEDLDKDILYVRGILLKINYMTEDSNSTEVPLKDKRAFISITNASLEECTYPLYNFFSIFTNPETVDPLDFINKIVVYNPSVKYKFDIDALIIYTKTATI